MLQTGRVEEVGSGIRNVNKYLPLYAKEGKSEFIEDDLFVTKIYLEKSGEELTTRVTQKTTQKIIELIQKNPQITRREMADTIGITEDGIKYHLNKMQRNKIIKRVGPDKGGYWKITK